MPTIEARNPRQLHRKLFYTYTVVVLIIAAGLMAYFVTAIRSRTIQANREEAARLQASAAEYISDADEIAAYLYGNLYQSGEVMKDLENAFLYAPELYQKKRLDRYSDSNSLESQSIYTYVEDAFTAYSAIKRVELVSYAKKEITYCYPEKTVYPYKKNEQRFKDILDNTAWEENEFYFRKEIRSTDTQKPIGCIMVIFDTARLDNISREAAVSTLLVTDEAGDKIWGDDSYDKDAFRLADEQGELEKLTDSYVTRQNVKEYQIYVLLDKKKAGHISGLAILAVLGIGTGLILVGELLINWYLHRLSQRLSLILEGMERVMTGDLTARLAVNENGDELDVISSHFNEMCRQLDQYIQKSYLAEIEQKNAQMQALQSQINPHFLYNTLEAIRMKAITNGDREVGKMLYSMAVTFRAQLKEKDVITLAQELHYCKKYLELFEYRYQGRFTSQVDCPLELMQCPVIKFVLQPLIENYFVHGIRMEANDNHIAISAERVEERLLIRMTDNGKGMPGEEVERQNHMLEENIYEEHSSIGLSNVNRRVKAVYGPQYGVRLKARPEGGLEVTLDIRFEEGKENEDSDVGGR
ncbi:MAG: sensor histidine kinase [Eubacteriales bacterium]|nr:sensor histidine kinase [Eubacteriales bacterium]